MPKPDRAPRKTTKPRDLQPDRSSVPLRARSGAVRHVLVLAGIIAFSFLAYSNSFNGGFVIDSPEIILKDTRVHAATAEHLRGILTGTYWELNPVPLYRPLTTLSYLFNYAILGNADNPTGYHWINFGLHAVNIALVYALGLMIFEQLPLALLLSLLWGIHPVLTESVTNIVGRADLLAGLGVLAGLLAYSKSIESRGAVKAAWLTAAALATAIGVFSKESGIVVIGLVVLYDLAFKRSTSLRSRVPGYAAVLLPCLIYLGVRLTVLQQVPGSTFGFADNPLVGAGFWTARLTATKVIGKYLGVLLWPRLLSGDYSYNAIPLFRWMSGGWEDVKTILALLVCVGAVIVALRNFRRHGRLFFGIGFFFVTLAPASNLVIKIGTIMAERLLYLPAIGFLICAVCGVDWVWKTYLVQRPSRLRTLVAALLVLVAVAAARTYDRNRDWSDESRYWLAAAEAAPGSYKPHLALAFKPYADSGNWPAAVQQIDRAMEILDPIPDRDNVWTAYLDAGGLYRTVGDQLAAKTGRPIHLSEVNPSFWYRKSLSVLLRSERMLHTADEEVRRQHVRRGAAALRLLPGRLYLEEGRTYRRLGDFEKARTAFETGRASESDPDLLEELADVYQRLGNVKAAAGALVEALYVDPGRAALRPKLIDLYLQMDPHGCAVTGNGSARDLNVECPLVHNDICAASGNLAKHYLERGQFNEAAASAQIAVRDFGCPADPAPR
jgi:tetratricopeptide (TPR) repeat protein